MMLMDIAIRFSKNGKMKITDADGNEQVRPILPHHCIRAPSHCVVEQTNRCWCALFVGDVGPMWCFACAQKSACKVVKRVQVKCCSSSVSEDIRNIQKKEKNLVVQDIRNIVLPPVINETRLVILNGADQSMLSMVRCLNFMLCTVGCCGMPMCRCSY